MASQINPYPLRTDETFFNKLRYIAKENGRSINKEIEFLIKQYVNQYEKENGIILIEEE